MAQQMNINKEAKQIQLQQAAVAMDHSCDNLLDVGGCEAAEHPFAAWLKAKNVKSIQTPFVISHETMIADGCGPAAHLWERLVAIEECCNLAKQDENRCLRFMGFSSNGSAKHMNSKVPTGILRPPACPSQNLDE